MGWYKVIDVLRIIAELICLVFMVVNAYLAFKDNQKYAECLSRSAMRGGSLPPLGSMGIAVCMVYSRFCLPRCANTGAGYIPRSRPHEGGGGTIRAVAE